MGSKKKNPPTPPPTDPDALLRVEHVSQLIGLGRTTIWTYVNRGEFPRPVKLGVRAIGWPRRVVIDWIESRPAA